MIPSTNVSPKVRSSLHIYASASLICDDRWEPQLWKSFRTPKNDVNSTR